VYFTFSAPVTLPGVTLPAGQYEFKLTSSPADRHIVQVYSKDNQKYVGMFFAIAAMRPTPTEKPEVTFLETSGGMPPAVQTWWYPGITTGHEFIYPRDVAEKLAKTNTKGVLTTKGDAKTGSITRLTASGETDVNASARDEKVDRDRGQAVPEMSNAAKAAPPEPPAADMNLQARATTPEPQPRRALPKTGSELPTILAMGLASLFAGLALTGRRRTV
jgi:LPXTG-motif cell wall-anchored protein